MLLDTHVVSTLEVCVYEFVFCLLRLRLAPETTPLYSSAASEVYKGQAEEVLPKLKQI